MTLLNAKIFVFVCELLFISALMAGDNLISNGDFEAEPSYQHLSGQKYYSNKVKEGWDFKVLGPLFQLVPIFTPQGGPAKVRQVEDEDVFQGKRSLYIKTSNRGSSFYRERLILPATLYDLSFYAKGSGQISFSTFVYDKSNKYIANPVFISVPLTKDWKKYETQIYIKNPEANLASLVINVKPSSEFFIDNIVLSKSNNLGTKKEKD